MTFCEKCKIFYWGSIFVNLQSKHRAVFISLHRDKVCCLVIYIVAEQLIDLQAASVFSHSNAEPVLLTNQLRWPWFLSSWLWWYSAVRRRRRTAVVESCTSTTLDERAALDCHGTSDKRQNDVSRQRLGRNRKWCNASKRLCLRDTKSTAFRFDCDTNWPIVGAAHGPVSNSYK